MSWDHVTSLVSSEVRDWSSAVSQRLYRFAFFRPMSRNPGCDDHRGARRRARLLLWRRPYCNVLFKSTIDVWIRRTVALIVQFARFTFISQRTSPVRETRTILSVARRLAGGMRLINLSLVGRMNPTFSVDRVKCRPAASFSRRFFSCWT